jgi:hypothetical protein
MGSSGSANNYVHAAPAGFEPKGLRQLETNCARGVEFSLARSQCAQLRDQPRNNNHTTRRALASRRFWRKLISNQLNSHNSFILICEKNQQTLGGERSLQLPLISPLVQSAWETEPIFNLKRRASQQVLQGVVLHVLTACLWRISINALSRVL